MDYWAETMQDDAYLIAADGWVRERSRGRSFRSRTRTTSSLAEPHDYLKGKRRFKSDLVPSANSVARYFASERDAIEALDEPARRA